MKKYKLWARSKCFDRWREFDERGAEGEHAQSLFERPAKYLSGWAALAWYVLSVNTNCINVYKTRQWLFDNKLQ